MTTFDDGEGNDRRRRRSLRPVGRIDWISIVGIAAIVGLCWAMTRLYRLELTGAI